MPEQTDCLNPIFQKSFKQYFDELGICVSDWNALFTAMNNDIETKTFIGYDDNKDCIGFIQIKPIIFSSEFFEEPYGFIRELWVNKRYRNCGYGTALMRFAEEYFNKKGICKTILTTNTAARFYEKIGYTHTHSCKAKNNDAVYTKIILM